MSALSAISITCFVPGGKFYKESQLLFEKLGFDREWEIEGYTGLRNGDARFILQDFHNQEMAENLMLKLRVPDLDRWWTEVAQRDLQKNFPGFRITPPKEFPWGREAHFVDLAGVCWQVRS